MKTSEICQDDTKRRRAVRNHKDTDGNPDLNGIDYIEVDETDQRILHVRFMDKAPENITEQNVRIAGGQRIRNIQVIEVRLCDPDDPDLADCMQVTVDKAGDFSTYTLCLVEVDESNPPADKPLSGFDPRYACVDFSFKANCPGDLDCQAVDTCPPGVLVELEIDYLAKDYASFRQLILDRLALIMPDWQERHIPDIGITLVEILAYVGDYLSYYQDAVSTEAYLETARQRISVRRHVRLVDYPMHEGCNARTWLFVDTNGSDTSLDPEDVYFITGLNDALPVSSKMLTDVDLQGIPTSDYEVFEPLFDAPLFLRLGDISNFASLIGKLKEKNNPVSRYLLAHFSAETQQLVAKYKTSDPVSAELRQVLIKELNHLIQHSSLYDPQRFAQVTLSDETKKSIQEMQPGQDPSRLNRLLLEDAYPAEIANSRKIHLYAAHDEIHFYTWDDQDCCLPRGATTATLDDSAPLPTPVESGPSEQMPQQQQTSPNPKGKTQKQEEPPTYSPPPPEKPAEPARKLHLQVGDVLIFEEVLGPKTGNPADANPTRRHAVRLTKVEPGLDALYDIPVVEIEWGAEDALPFPLCLSAIGPAPDCKLLTDISIARGNIILVDYGKTVPVDQGKIGQESLGNVPIEPTIPKCEGEGNLAETAIIAGIFRPTLQQAPLTFSEPLPIDTPMSLTSATHLLLQNPRQALPSIELTSTPPVDVTKVQVHDKPGYHDENEDEGEDEDEDKNHDGTGKGDDSQAVSSDITWIVQHDLLESQGDDYHFVVEMDNDGFAHLHFGDGELGRIPEAGTKFHAKYRVGNGLRGNVGAEAISHIVSHKTRFSGLTLQPRNPFAVYGGTDPEPLAEIKLFAPHAFRTDLQRAITADDYARLAERNPKIQHAAATLRWTGSWYEVLVAIDPPGSEEADQPLLDEIAAYLEHYRRIGHDLKVVAAHYVSLDIELTVCVQAHFLRGHVKAALLDLFSNHVLPNGRLGFFHPDNLTFGTGIAVSKLVAVAQAVPGVQNVNVTKLERLFEGSNHELDNEFLPLGPHEIARLDNDPSFPEHGKLVLKMVGGR